MKKLGALLLSLMLLYSCGREKTVVEEKYPDGTPKVVVTYAGSGETRQKIKETTYYQDKKIQMTGGFKNNARDGHWVYYYPTGRIWSEGDFRNGKSYGKRTTYFESGKVRYTGYFKDDKRIGTWKFYDEAGYLIKEVNYSK